jgi:hypothetical protein
LVFNGDTIIAGSSAEKTAGAAHVLRRNLQSWVSEWILSSGSTDAIEFCWQIALDGDLAVASA